MIKRGLSILILLFCLSGCNFQKHYSQNDYSFYQENFKLPASLLRTDGVYVLHKIWTKNGGPERIVAADKIYKFYGSGQVNLILDIDKKLNVANDYLQAFNKKLLAKTELEKSTLFEGYYKVQGDRVVIQQVSVPRKQFFYIYGLLKQDTLILVKETHLGKGKIKDKYFTDYYKAYYTFVPTELDYLKPNW